METVLSYAYVNVSVRKHCLSKKITAHVMSAAINNLLDKLEFKSFFYMVYNADFRNYFSKMPLYHIL